MSEHETLGSRIRKLRKDLNLPQVDVAAALHISRSHYAEIEGGAHPGFATFIEMSKFFSKSLDYLYFGTPSDSENIGDASIKGEEKVLIEFWRGLSSSQRDTLFDLLIRDKDHRVA